MRVLMAQFKIKEEALQDFNTARDQILCALANERPKGIRYTWCAMPDRISFIGWLELDEGIENPLPSMEAGKKFMKDMQKWVAAPPIREELTVVGAYPHTR
jgi:hypothetical protein